MRCNFQCHFPIETVTKSYLFVSGSLIKKILTNENKINAIIIWNRNLNKKNAQFWGIFDFWCILDALQKIFSLIFFLFFGKTSQLILLYARHWTILNTPQVCIIDWVISSVISNICDKNIAFYFHSLRHTFNFIVLWGLFFLINEIEFCLIL